jgi:citronellol/citronellal dehydrogenase
MLTLSQSAASEWAGSGVRVNVVAPGGIASSGFDTYTPEAFEEIRKVASGVPLQRFGNEAEVSSAIVYLLSPAASYITGTYIRVDGGSPNARQTGTLATESRVPPFDGFHRALPTRS